MQRPSRRHIVLAVLLLGAIAFLVYSLMGASSPAGTEGALQLSEREVAQAADRGQDREPEPVVGWDVEFDRYQPMLRRSAFSERGAEPPPEREKREPLPPPPPFEKTPEEKEPAPRRIDFSGWTYAGYIVLNGKQMGLLQSESGDSLKELSVGDKFLGATVREITGEAMRLAYDSQTATLHRMGVFPLTPLDNAASEAGQPRRQRPGRGG